MPRPIKNNADYFSHDADMRDDPKVKALRTKFGIAGYGVYCMTLEYMTDKDFFEFELSDTEVELMAGDFRVPSEEIKAILEYCFILDLFQCAEGKVQCRTLQARLKTVIEKREEQRSKSDERKRNKKGEFLTQKQGFIPQKLSSTGESDAVSPQSKVKKSKVKKSISVNGADAPTHTIADRKKNLYNQLTPYLQEYGKQTLRDFYEYWTEGNKSGKLMRFEAERFFDVGRRLATWRRMERMRDNVKSEAKPPEDPYAEARYNKTLWTLEAWESKYRDKLKDNKFRKVFGYEQLRKGSTVGSDA